MEHLTDELYKGFEIRVYSEGSTYAIDIVAQEGYADGAIAAFNGIAEQSDALWMGKIWVDGYSKAMEALL